MALALALFLGGRGVLYPSEVEQLPWPAPESTPIGAPSPEATAPSFAAAPAVVSPRADDSRPTRELSNRGRQSPSALPSETATTQATATQPAPLASPPATPTRVPLGSALPTTAPRLLPTAFRVPTSAPRLLATAFQVPTTATTVPVPSNVSVAAEDTALVLVNEERQARGLPPVVMYEPLRRVARAHSLDMASRGYFAHNTPESLTPFDRIRAAGIAYSTAGENLGFSSLISDPVAAVLAQHQVMMAELPPDDGHVRTMLNPTFRRVGVGVVITPDLRIYYSCDFIN